MKYPTSYFSLSAWRIILRLNIAINEWMIWLYRYQMANIGEPSHPLMDRIAELEGDLLKWQIELRYL